MEDATPDVATTGRGLNHLIFTTRPPLTTSGRPDVVLDRDMLADREPLPSDLATAHAMILAERDARQRAEALVSAATLEIERLKLLLARMRRERFGQSSERGAKLIEQLELQLAELEEGVAEEEATAEIAAPSPE